MSLCEIQYTQDKSNKEEHTMTAYTSKMYAATRCASAVACSSARITKRLDTAYVLAVSICVLWGIIPLCFR